MASFLLPNCYLAVIRPNMQSLPAAYVGSNVLLYVGTMKPFGEGGLSQERLGELRGMH